MVSKAAEGFLNSTFFFWVKTIFFIGGTAFILYTWNYMRKNRGRPWWVAPPVKQAPAVVPDASMEEPSKGGGQ
jgi:hypothetical protein